MPFIAVRDIEVYYEIHTPDGVTDPGRVVLINGTGGDLRANPARGRGPLERACEVLMYDQRGLGQSGKPDQDYTMADYADDCVALMDAVGWDSADVMGVSFGGMVAQHVVLRHPKRVNRLILACTASGGEGGRSFDLLAIHDLPAEERLQIIAPLMDTRNDLSTDPPTLAPMFDVLLPMMRGRAPLNSADPNAASGARRQLEARAGHDVWDFIDQIENETLVLGGDFDRQAPPENVRNLAERIPNTSLEFFGGGHLFLLQDPAAWASVVSFLDG